MELIDRASEVRKGEELNQAALETYLRDSIKGLGGKFEIRQFPGGFSNLTYLVKSGDREMILRMPPFGKKAKTAHDMEREFSMLKALKPHFPYCPEPLLFCADESITGGRFYVMERLRGIILRKNLPEGLSFSPAEAGKLSENLIKVLCELHSIDYKIAGLENMGKPDGYVKRQVEGWSRRYRDSVTPDAPSYDKVMQWLADKMPELSPPASIIHNDFKFDNAVLDPGSPLKITGILDWEMSTIGDPLMDLGNSLAYWVEKDDPPAIQAIRLMPTNLEGMLTRKQQIELYSRLRGIKNEGMDFYLCFGLFRLAVIAQQIYYRYYHGQTKDARFKMLIAAVKILEGAALELIEKSNL